MWISQNLEQVHQNLEKHFPLPSLFIFSLPHSMSTFIYLYIAVFSSFKIYLFLFSIEVMGKNRQHVLCIQGLFGVLASCVFMVFQTEMLSFQSRGFQTQRVCNTNTALNRTSLIFFTQAVRTAVLFYNTAAHFSATSRVI